MSWRLRDRFPRSALTLLVTVLSQVMSLWISEDEKKALMHSQEYMGKGMLDTSEGHPCVDCTHWC